jgi:hypothetical protein
MTTENARRERMSRIAPENMTEAQRKAAAELAAGPRGEVRGPFNVLLRSPELMSPLQKVGEYLRFKCALDRRIAEMATLIAARHWTQVYEWNAHHPLALKAGLKPEVAQAIAEGRRPTGMADDEEVVYDVLTEALQNKSVSDDRRLLRDACDAAQRRPHAPPRRKAAGHAVLSELKTAKKRLTACGGARRANRFSSLPDARLCPSARFRP